MYVRRLPNVSRQPQKNHMWWFSIGTYYGVSSTALAGISAPLEDAMCCILKVQHLPSLSPPVLILEGTQGQTKLGRLRKVLHHLPIASFPKRICRKVETTILSLGGMGDSHFSFHTIAL